MIRSSPEFAPAGGPLPSARPIGFSRERVNRRLLIDRISRRFVTLGGVMIIASILAILVVIVVEMAPLFRPPSAREIGTLSVRTTAPPLAIGVDEHRQIAYLITGAGVELISAADGRPLGRSFRVPDGARVTGVSDVGRGTFALGLADGRVVPVEVRFSVTFPQGKRRVDAEVVPAEPLVVDPRRRQVARLTYVAGEEGPIAAVVTGPREVALLTVKETKALVGPATREQARRTIAIAVDGEITDVALDNRGDHLFAGTSAGRLAVVDIREGARPDVIATAQAASRAGDGISVLGFLLGDRTLIVGDTGGGVAAWRVLGRGSEQRLARISEFAAHQSPVVAIAPSRRDKGFLTADALGSVFVHYGTTGRTLLNLSVDREGIRSLTFAPKVDGFLTVGAGGDLRHWDLRNPHPEVTFRTLFGKVWYEGYEAPAYVWQSTGATDDFESKLSLTPLIYGTLKGTFYALLFAVPMALLGALYASQFMHPALRNAIKPIVEIMAALPSVVLGFLAGLWLAPRLEKIVPGLFLMPFVVPLFILLTLALWRRAPIAVRRRVRPGTELFVLTPAVVLGAWLALRLGAGLEALLLGGDYRGWLLSALGLTYDQRNSLVVGFAMGFAVIPIIFTIAEDSLSNVPAHLRAGSLALGATRWQTAIRVIVPTASPGIFSAVMIGFGRAVGETMIVLMATGNTPVMNWSMFSGFRALSANVAVELPEAPAGGTLYRVLFVAAFLLFVMTFLVNTAAEIVRLRLRRRYQVL